MTTASTVIAPGTVVSVAPTSLPPEDRTGDLLRTVLDQSRYDVIQDPTMLLIPSPGGWRTTVRSGQPDAGAEARVYWINPGNVTVVDAPAADGLTDIERDLALRAANTVDLDLRRSETLRVVAEHKRQFAAAVEQREALGRDLDGVRNLLRSERAAYEDFRVKVRDTAIRVAREQDWCDEGLNGVLDDLGLDRKTQAYNVEVEVEFTLRKTVTVRIDAASDEDDAREQVNSSEVEDALANEGEWPDGDDVNLDDWTVQSVDVTD